MELEQQNKSRGLAVLGIALDEEGWQVVKPFLTSLRVNYRTLMGTGAVAQLYGGVDSIPTTFLIDRQGRIASVHLGLVNKRVYEREIAELLGAPQEAAAR
jgi:cytochrome c biogenesis protein CcmG/thiol:disulfide interchange protein DsbE